uniref:Uncharacterized protein n=1 Tax=Opuntia streptacantha TaxID=393608 RepID=A0A7C9EN06_OPUST
MPKIGVCTTERLGLGLCNVCKLGVTILFQLLVLLPLVVLLLPPTPSSYPLYPSFTQLLPAPPLPLPQALPSPPIGCSINSPTLLPPPPNPNPIGPVFSGGPRAGQM